MLVRLEEVLSPLSADERRQFAALVRTITAHGPSAEGPPHIC
jgi:hypothetical protein